MVDMGLQEQGRLFTANDCTVGGDESILLITGYVIRTASSITILTLIADLTWQERVPISGRTP
jgi:hypothetical protein